METLPHELLAQIALWLSPVDAMKLNTLNNHFHETATFHHVSFALKSLQLHHHNTPATLLTLPPSFCAAFVSLHGIEQAATIVGVTRLTTAMQKLSEKSIDKHTAKDALLFAANTGSVILTTVILDKFGIGPDCVPNNCPCSSCQSTDLCDSAETLDQTDAVAPSLESSDPELDLSPTPLGMAAHLGHLDLAQYLISRGADPQSIGSDSDRLYCPLNLATQGGHGDIMLVLLENGANPNQRDYGEWTPLHWAAEAGNTNLCTILLNHGAHVDAGDQQNRTALHWAVSKGRLDVTRFLVEKGASVHARTTSNTTPIHLAAANGHLDVLQYLIARGADTNAVDATHRTPLHSACDDGHETLCSALLDSGANIDSPDDDEYMPLHVAVSNRHHKVVQVLVDRNASLSARTINGNTALHLATSTDDVELVRIIACHWKSTCPETRTLLHTTKNSARHTPLHHACCLGTTATALELVPDTPSIILLDPSQHSPLLLAIRFGHLKTIQSLLPYIVSHCSGTMPLLNSALDFTIECFLSLRPFNSSVDRDIARLLVENGANITPIWELNCSGDGCGKDKIEGAFYKCMICETIYCEACRERAKNEAGFHEDGHGFLVGDKQQVLDFLLNGGGDEAADDV
ncbi:UNVERIFIED_CONTAM: hypothetical protein HDU68_003799 [Siphonaria sp. JEL0065]|nr:hypothetical protein HDU68_003799 [Siphonaria sp. JEL0065]